MDRLTELLIGKLLDIAIAASNAVEAAGINYREVMDAQELAAAEGREMNQEERKPFLDQAQSAVNRL